MKKSIAVVAIILISSIPSYAVLHPSCWPCFCDHKEESVAGPSIHSYFFDEPGPEYFGMDTESNAYKSMLDIRRDYEALYAAKQALIDEYTEELATESFAENACANKVAEIRTARQDVEDAWVAAVYDVLELMPQDVYDAYIDYLEGL
jgi:hypothetical protein